MVEGYRLKVGKEADNEGSFMEERYSLDDSKSSDELKCVSPPARYACWLDYI